MRLVRHRSARRPRLKIADADGADAAGVVELLHGAPAAVVVAQRLVNQVEVKVIKPELLHRGLEGAHGRTVAGVLHPYLCSNKQLIARNTATRDGGADGLLVVVNRSRIDMAIPCGNRVDDRLLALGRVGNLVDAKAGLRDAHTVGKLHGRNSNRCTHKNPFV